jgi:hypothetical protein
MPDMDQDVDWPSRRCRIDRSGFALRYDAYRCGGVRADTFVASSSAAMT